MVRSGSTGYMDDGYVPDYHTGRKMSASQYEVIFQGHTSSSAKLGKLIHFLNEKLKPKNSWLRKPQSLEISQFIKLFILRFPKKSKWKVEKCWFFLCLVVKDEVTFIDESFIQILYFL